MSDLSWLLGALEPEKEAVYPMFPVVPNIQNPVWEHKPETETLAVTGFQECVPSDPNVPNEKQAPRENHSVVSVFVSFRWLIHFTDREPIVATFSPMATHAEALTAHPGAVAAVPVGRESMRRIPNPKEAAQLRFLVDMVYRDDSEDDRNEALQAALADPDNALACYTAIPSERGLTPADTDDRRACRQCLNLTYSGACSVASPGGALSAVTGYRPGALFLEQAHRCEAFTNSLK